MYKSENTYKDMDNEFAKLNETFASLFTLSNNDYQKIVDEAEEKEKIVGNDLKIIESYQRLYYFFSVNLNLFNYILL